MGDRAWKAFERKVAKILGGKRIPSSGAAPGFKGDVEHPLFFIECKHGLQIPKTIVSWYLKAKEQAKKESKIPIVVMKPRGKHDEYVFISLTDFAKLFSIVLAAFDDEDLETLEDDKNG